MIGNTEVIFTQKEVIDLLEELKEWAQSQIGMGCSDHTSLAKETASFIEEKIKTIKSY